MRNKMIDLWEGLSYEGADTSFRPTLETFLIKGDTPRGAVLICPGGGYEMTSEREAEPIALQMNAAGFHAFVLWYSVSPNKHPQPLWDASRAMGIIRSHAEEWRIKPDRIAVCGFSAGGHLAASLGVHWHQPWLQDVPGAENGGNRPDALILNYPVISSGKYAHKGSFAKLLGPDADAELMHDMSLEFQVSELVPPTFLWHTVEDGAVPVENSMMFAQALQREKIPFELHLFPDGPHGLALATMETGFAQIQAAKWVSLCVGWLAGLGWEKEIAAPL